MTVRDPFERCSNYFLNIPGQESLLGRRDVCNVGTGRKFLSDLEILIGERSQIQLGPEESSLEIQPRGFRQIMQSNIQHLDAQLMEAFVQTSLGNQEIKLFVFRRQRGGSLKRFQRRILLAIADQCLRK